MSVNATGVLYQSQGSIDESVIHTRWLSSLTRSVLQLLPYSSTRGPFATVHAKNIARRLPARAIYCLASDSSAHMSQIMILEKCPPSIPHLEQVPEGRSRIYMATTLLLDNMEFCLEETRVPWVVANPFLE